MIAVFKFLMCMKKDEEMVCRNCIDQRIKPGHTLKNS